MKRYDKFILESLHGRELTFGDDSVIKDNNKDGFSGDRISGTSTDQHANLERRSQHYKRKDKNNSWEVAISLEQ